jgi:hypothetical protein
MIDATDINPCSGPLCLRDVKRDPTTGDYRFTVDIRTSLGVIKVRGWKWIRGLNRISAPSCAQYVILRMPANGRSVVRKLLREILLKSRGFEIPKLKRGEAK